MTNAREEIIGLSDTKKFNGKQYNAGFRDYYSTKARALRRAEERKAQNKNVRVVKQTIYIVYWRQK